MLKRYQHFVCEVFRVADAFIIVAAWLAAYWLRFYLTPIEIKGGLPPFETYTSLAPLVAVLWLTVFSLMRLYESQRLTRIRHELLLVLKAHAVATRARTVLCTRWPRSTRRRGMRPRAA